MGNILSVNRVGIKYLALGVMFGIFLTGCSSVLNKHVEWETVAPESYPVILAIGYAPI